MNNLFFLPLAVLVLVPGTQGQVEDCPSGWHYHRRHCYQVFYDGTRYSPSKTWLTSRTHCLSQGSHLASIRSVEERQSIISFLSTHASFGLNTVNVYIGLRILDGVLRWDDGRPLTSFNKWAPGQPILGNSGGDCVYMTYSNGFNRDFWYTGSCNLRSQRWHMCKRPSVCGPATSRYYYQNKCYTFNSNSLSHRQASTMCRLTHNSELLSLHSDRESQFVSTWAANAVSGTWLWTGLNSSDQAIPFQWLDGTALDYQNWFVGEPAELSTPRCAEVFKSADGNPSQFKWRVVNCDFKRPSLCVEHLANNDLVPYEDSKEDPVLITNPQIPAALFSVGCTSLGMSFVLPFSISPPRDYSTPCLAGDADDSYVRYHWGNQAGEPGTSTGPLGGLCDCAARRDDGNQQWIFDFKYDDCRTHAGSLVPDKISYVNTIYSGELSQEEQSMRANGTLTSNHSGYDGRQFVSIGLRCDFNNVLKVDGYGFIVDVFTSKVFNITNIGVFTMESSFLEPQTQLPATSPSNEPVLFGINSPITYELRLDTASELGLRPLECWISTGDYQQYPRGFFIRDGCPSLNNVNIGDTQWLNQSSATSTRYLRLSFNAFAFEGQVDSTYYMHCTFRICAPRDNRPCEPVCGAVNRKRRQVSDAENTVTISSQPFRLDTRNEGSGVATIFASPTSLVIILTVAIVTYFL